MQPRPSPMFIAGYRCGLRGLAPRRDLLPSRQRQYDLGYVAGELVYRDGKTMRVIAIEPPRRRWLRPWGK